MPQLLPVNTISELRRLNVALPRHTKDVLYDHRLFFTSLVNYHWREHNTKKIREI